MKNEFVVIKGQIEDLTKVESELKELISEESIHLSPLLCMYFTNYGITTKSSTICDILLDFEKQGLIEITRNPALTPTGKKSTFMKEEKKREVIIRKI